MFRYPFIYFLFLTSLMVAMGSVSRVFPQGDWLTPTPSIQLINQTEQYDDGASFTYHAMWVDLDHPAFQGMMANTPFESGGVVSDFAIKHDLAAAWNANFFSSFSQPCGVMQGDGVRWLRAYDDENCNGAAGFAEGPNPMVLFFFQPDAVNGLIVPWMRHIVAGGPGFIVEDGIPIANVRCDSLGSLQPCVRHPRLAMGLNDTGRSLLVVTVDGAPDSAGATLEEIARLSSKLGAQRVINLCGGSRATLYVRDAGGVVNLPAGGQENEVCCKIGIRIDPQWVSPDASADITPDTDIMPDADMASNEDTESAQDDTNLTPATYATQTSEAQPTSLPSNSDHAGAPASCTCSATRGPSALHFWPLVFLTCYFFLRRSHRV